jgi:hypothetical protein
MPGACHHHLGREDARGAVEGREGLVEHGHVAADRGPALDEVDLVPGVRDLEGGLDPGDPRPDDERVRADLRGPGLCREPERHAVDGAGDDRLRAVEGVAVLGPARRAVLAERGETDQLGIAARLRQRARERRLEEAGRVPADDDLVETLASDLLGERLGVERLRRGDDAHRAHPRQLDRVVGDGLEVQRASRPVSPTTEVHPDPPPRAHGSLLLVHRRLPCG